MIRDSLEGVMKALACKTSSTTVASESGGYAEALDILETVTEIEQFSPKYHYAAAWLQRKENRILWFKARTNVHRLSTIDYHYAQHLASGGI